MRVEPKLNGEPPYRWIGHITLTPQEVEEIINALPPDIALRLRLRKAWDNAAARADKLNRLEREGVQ